MQRMLFFLCCLISTADVLAQNIVRDSSLFDPHVTVSYAYQIPGGDLASRFRNNSNIGIGWHIKSKENWYYGIQGTFIFGGKVIQEQGFLQNLKVENDNILDNDGSPARFSIQERGFTAAAEFGRLFSVIGPNRNSGILVKGSAGFLQHKIRIEHQDSEIRQLEGDYLKGYDRLTNGPMIGQFVGYYHMSNNRLINFCIGLEAWQGFTQSRRSYNFDTRTADTEQRLDALVGLRVGWTLHLYKRISNDFYY